MHLYKYEKIWLIFGTGVLALFLLIVGIGAFAMGHEPPSDDETIDPQKVRETPPFDNPGLKQIGDQEYELVIVAQAFAFQPSDIEIPKGAKVHFIVTSPDVVHGLAVAQTNVNMMVTPGHINRITHTFKDAGEYLMVCNEYCGTGHQFMGTRIEVVE
ncbi:cytochrome c oxidase subunit II [Bacillus horti]|uniref:Cytochrome aa3 subunit 2 n=1 Tax=Caldalkalibacillus horti TaxID=77523 RepID=A0ABT9VTJ6_9BACI|nr:cytochrome c oxidase subunit II [Bacillus horti]MDQ0164308.1 cytochrome c oxidase subunit 2 [Bacillus horti]